MPGSCSSGFRSRPSAGTSNWRSNGFDVSSRNIRNPTLIKPITANVRATIAIGMPLLKRATAPDQIASMSIQRSNEPS